MQFVEALNELYDQPDSWWRRLVDDRSLFLAVRDNYVNVYWLGCSLLRLNTVGEPGSVEHIANVAVAHFRTARSP